MRILPTRRYRCREIKHVNLDRTMQPVDKDEYPVRELDLHDCNFLNGRTYSSLPNYFC